MAAGLRVAEALALEPRDLRLDTDRPTVRIREGKGQQSREVPVHPELQAAIIAATSYGAVGGGPLVDVSRTTAWRWVQLAAKRTIDTGQLDRGLHVGTHTLRHSYARHLLLNGYPELPQPVAGTRQHPDDAYLSGVGAGPCRQPSIGALVGADRADTTTSQKWQSLPQSLPPATLSQPTPAMSARRTTPDSTSTKLFPTPVRCVIIGAASRA